MFKSIRWFKPSILLSMLIIMTFLTACTIESLPQSLPIDVEATVESAVEATLTAVVSPGVEANGVTEAETPIAIEGGTEAIAEASPTPPLLITPTPDRSGEIMAAILENTRHIKGNPDATVTLVEFSDFM